MPKQRRPALTAEFVRSILDYYPKIGLLIWRYRPDMPRGWNTRYAGKVAGSTKKTGYVYVQIGKGQHYAAHQLAWCHYHGEWPSDQMDHEAGKRSDNRIEKIRPADPSQNGCNKAMQRNNTSGYVGVSFDKQRMKWRARINRDGKMHDLGFHETEQKAAAVRAQFVTDIHGEFATENTDRQRYPHSRDHARPPLDDL